MWKKKKKESLAECPVMKKEGRRSLMQTVSKGRRGKDPKAEKDRESLSRKKFSPKTCSGAGKCKDLQKR